LAAWDNLTPAGLSPALPDPVQMDQDIPQIVETRGLSARAVSYKNDGNVVGRILCCMGGRGLHRDD
jgi:hypothetical protein